MTDDIKVTVHSHGQGRNLALRWLDPETGKRREKSAGTPYPGKAERAARDLEKELRTGKYAAGSRLTWQDFTWRYQDQVAPSLAAATGAMIGTVFNAVERIIAPERIGEITAARLSGFQAKLREEGKSEASIRSYLAHLRSALNWAVDVGMIRYVPKFPKLQRAKGSKVMKGRPVDPKEFHLMLLKVEEGLYGKPKDGEPALSTEERAARAPVVASWRHYLRGLWWSGLRLRESLDLHWDGHHGLLVDLSGDRPMLRIPAAFEKGNQDRLLPVAPEFAEFLLQTPECDRHGRVFRLRGVKPKRPQGGGIGGKAAVTDANWVSKLVVRIGTAAGVVVDVRTKPDRKTGRPTQAIKYASPHDLRRSFGERWASRVMPQVLMQLMRHESIDTTLRYYVGRNAQRTAEVLWEAYEREMPIGDIFGDKAPEAPLDGRPRNDTSP